jgi:CDP-paratose 2-epimerase
MKILITGGAGFIGANCAAHFAKENHKVVIFDNLSRPGSDKNLDWIKNEFKVEFIKGDLRNFKDLVNVFNQNGKFDLILHMAAQVAVTTSVTNPRDDFEINTIGTFNLLEAMRLNNPEACLIYASTNKVYGEMDNLKITLNNGRYTYKDLVKGIDENRNLDFHSPYGCSKGAADQYCLDYYRIYGLRTIVMRQSCIYGYRQFGIEDQGWVAWFIIAAQLGKQITIYGDGKQVRDVLFIDDLIHAYELAFKNRKHLAGRVFNIGGGPEKTLSLNELIKHLEILNGRTIPLAYDDWRAGDQKVYISNVSLSESEFGWKPKTLVEDGVEKLHGWVKDNIQLFGAF